jgi:pimeloyl-ACP methyl ester carboxylesterase
MIGMRIHRPLPLALALLAGTSLASAAATPAPAAPILTDVPARIDTGARHLFYLHGRILELQGRDATSPDFGPYQYDAILQAFARRGFTVISEVRQGDAGMPFVRKLVGQVRRLLAAGVPAQHVTVVGASKGGFLTLAAAAELGEAELSYVVLAGCGPSTVRLAPRLRGRVLSIHDSRDRYSPSCEETFRNAPSLGPHKEIVLELGLDHGLLYAPREEWVAPATEWARGK